MNKKPDEDDGRTYADMNIDGMPWYSREKTLQQTPEKIQLSKAESRAVIWGALKAALLVTMVFALVFFLFLLFCDKVWFKTA